MKFTFVDKTIASIIHYFKVLNHYYFWYLQHDFDSKQ